MSLRRAAALAAALSTLVVLVLVPAAPAAAAVCDDYETQADAQRAADTRDGDGDGIYCEALPCPCLKPGEEQSSRDDRARGEARRGRRENAGRRPPGRFRARIVEVVDGDTLRVRRGNGERYTIRLIGIDTPETKHPDKPVECGGPLATHTLLRLAFPRPRDRDGDGLYDHGGGRGRAVVVRTDPTQDLFDAFDRLLAYVTTRAGRNLALEQLRRGMARLYVFEHRFRDYRRFRRAERRARARNRGIWGRCGG